MLEKVINKFNIPGELLEIQVNTSGNINNTYVAKIRTKENKIKKYLIQKINTNVFTDPYKLMSNIENVTNYLKIKMKGENDTTHQILETIKTKDGKNLCCVENNYYRIYQYIDNSIVYDNSIDTKIIYNAGKAFGNFARLLIDYPITELYETIPNFHNTEMYYQKLLADIKIASPERVQEVTKELDFIIMHKRYYSLITNKLGTKDLPYRVIHNDAKINNVMMNKKTTEYLAVIDLDTVMPGSILFDYGDGIRSAASTTSENEQDLTKIKFDLDSFKAYTDGYLSEMTPYITTEELSLMGESIRIITLELAIRFLDDYINNDIYFKINYEKHNLNRAKNQLTLVTDIENKISIINNYIIESYNKSKDIKR